MHTLKLIAGLLSSDWSQVAMETTRQDLGSQLEEKDHTLNVLRTELENVQQVKENSFFNNYILS